MQQGIEQWHRGDINYALAEMMAGSTGVVRVLQQPAVIAATGSLLWLALLALLLLERGGKGGSYPQDWFSLWGP